MKKTLTKVVIVSLLSIVALNANENINRSISSTAISNTKNNSAVINKNTLQDIQRKALISAGKSLDFDTSLFDKNKKFSLYLKISSKSRFGFKYKF